MKDYAQIVSKVTSTPWMITPDALKMLLSVLDMHMSGDISVEEIKRQHGLLDMGVGEPQPMSSRVGDIGIINLSGPIFPKANLMTEYCGATSLEQFQKEFRSLMTDGNVRKIVMKVDSPGGLSDRVDEMATELRAAREIKPLYSIADTAANSAAYYLASQATQMWATPSGQLGSIGTFTVHTDASGQREMMGLKDTVIKAGRFKAATMEPLTPESLDHLQQYVNEVNDQFIMAVAKGRKTDPEYVRENYGEGGIVSPRYALDNGMIDAVGTFDQLMESIPTGGGVSFSGANSVSQTGNVYVNPSSVVITTTDNTSGVTNLPGTRQSYDADKEHSEPGTGLGGEPTPREAPEKDDKAIEGGWRRDPPPIAYESEENAVNRAWLEARATALGIDFDGDVSDEELATKIEGRIDEIIVPLQSVSADVEKQRQFEKDYPEQAAALAKLTADNSATAAKAFASEYARFDGSNKGFSTVVRENIEAAHGKIAMGQYTHTDLKELLDLVTSSEATVEWGEEGSSRTGDESAAPTRNFVEDRKKFAELVRAAMVEDNLSQDAAVKHVSKQHPDLAEAYLIGHAR